MSSSEDNSCKAPFGGAKGGMPGPMKGFAFPAHNPELLMASIDQAKKFYGYDSKLNSADRQQLANFFWQRMTIYPVLGIPVVAGFIMIPNILKKRGVLNPKKNYRLLQVGLGFLGLGAGFKFGGAIAGQVHTARLADNEAAKQSYLCLSKYPPQLGSNYYQLTARYPELAFKDPEKIDWKRSPIFPMCLIMNRDVFQHFQGMRSEAEGKRAGLAAGGPVPPSKDIPLTGTSWDNVILRSEGKTASKPDTSSSSTPPLPEIQKHNVDLSEEQRKFDELLDKERDLASHDSFVNSEKKWD